VPKFHVPILALLTCCAAGVLAEDIPLFDAKDPAKGWHFNNGAEFPGATGEVAFDPQVQKDGQPSLRLVADLSKGGNYVDMERNVADQKLEVESVSFWLKAPGLERVTLRLVDGADRCHQIGLSLGAPSDEWRLVTFPIARFFAKRGTAEAVAGVDKYESWGGDPKRGDGWVGHLRNFVLLAGRHGQAATVWVSQLVATVRAGTVGWSCGFEGSAALPAGWSHDGPVTIATDQAFAGTNALRLERAAAQRDKPCAAASPTFAVAPGLWEISAAASCELESPDASYCGALRFEALDAGGAVIATSEIAVPYGSHPWQVLGKRVTMPYQTVAGRFTARIEKTVGTFRVDELTVKPLDTARRLPAVERLVVATPSLGNLILPDAPRTVAFTVETRRELAPAERTLTWVVRDYWGAEQSAPASVPLTADGRNKERFRYRAAADLAGVALETGRYYEVHAQVPLADNEPYHDSAGLAIVPVAASKAFPPAKIPFTARDWDNRIPDYIRLSDRLGFRTIGLWGSAEPKEPYRAQAPGIELCKELGAAILTGCPANLNAIEYHHPGWEKWTDETTIRGAIRSWFTAFGNHAPKPIVVNLGNEPHGTGEQVKQQVRAYKIAYDELKKVAPDCIVVATSVEPNEEYFQAGYQDACDAFDFHIYETPADVRNTLAQYQALMAKYHCVKPMWSTEIGLNSQGLTRQHIAADMVRKFAAFFAAGGTSMNWFDLLYPDGDGRALGTSGDAFNMFDSRYNAYAARLDAVSCYNLINGILDKPFVQERAWADGVTGCLFRDAAGHCFAIIDKTQGRADLTLPLAGVDEVVAIAIDGRRTTFKTGGKGVGLSVGPDPVLLAYDGPAELPAQTAAPLLRIASAPLRLMRGVPGVVEVATTGDAKLVTLEAPLGWIVERAAAQPLRFAISSPAGSLAREGTVTVRLSDAAGATKALVGCRPILTGRLGVEIHGAAKDGKPAVELVVSNQSQQAQTVTWTLALAGERALVGGAYAAPVKTSAYLGAAGTGSLTIPPAGQMLVALPLAATVAGRIYQVDATITDASGGTVAGEAEIKP
jgi:hypothetical protein